LAGRPAASAGSDLLRSKSFDRDSYNSGDWFNKLDFTYQSNNFGVGLPVASKNQDNWTIIGPFLADPALNPALEDIEFSTALFQELLQMRYSSPLFRLQSSDAIMDRVAFHNTGPAQLPGLIVMSISDLVEPDLDGDNEFIVVVVNANDEMQTFTSPELFGMDLLLHPVQMVSVDDIVKTASFDAGTGIIKVPARTTAVFVVEVPPLEKLGDLIGQIESLVDGGVLNSGQGNALVVKLEAAIKNLEKMKVKTALNELNAFINQVMALADSGVLPQAEAQFLIEEVQAIIDQINLRYQP